MALERLVKEHFEEMAEIQRHQENKKEIDEEIVKEIVETKQFDFLTVNWKRLHRFAFGHPGRKG